MNPVRKRPSALRSLGLELGKRLFIVHAGFIGGAVPPWVLMSRWPNWFDRGDFDYFLVGFLAMNVGLFCGGASTLFVKVRKPWEATPRSRVLISSLCVFGIGVLSSLLVSVTGTVFLHARS